jgi:hypothetical protein
MKICPFIFAVSRLAAKNVQSSGKDSILDGQTGGGELEFSAGITRKD